MNDLLDNVRVLNALQQRDFADSGRRYSVVFLLESNFFEGYNLVGNLVFALVDNTVGSFS